MNYTRLAHSLRLLRVLGRWGLCLAMVARAIAQVEPAGESPAPVALEVVRSQIQAIEANTTLDGPRKARILELYRQTLTDLEVGRALDAERQQRLVEASSVPGELNRVQRELASTWQPVELPELTELPPERLDDQVRQLQLQVADAKQRVQALEHEVQRREDRRLAVPASIAALHDSRATLEADFNAANVAAAIPELREATNTAHEVKLWKNRLELRLLQEELAYYGAAAELLPQQVELAQRTLERLTAELNQWTAAADARRRESARRDEQEKATKASEVPPELRPLADHNLTLSQTLPSLVKLIEQATNETVVTQAQVAEWNDQLARTQALVDVQAGVTESVGSLLRDQRDQLPSPKRIEAANARRRAEIDRIRSEAFAINEELLRFSTPQRRVAIELAALAATVPAERVAELRDEVQTLLDAQQVTLQELKRNYEIYLRKLLELSVEQEKQLTVLSRFIGYIDKNVLWIRSVPPMRWSDVTTVPQLIQSLGTTTAWRDLLQASWVTIQQQWPLHALIGVVLGTGLFYRQRGIRRISELGQMAKSRTCRDFQVTAKTVIWTLLVSALGPACLMWVGWTLDQLPSGAESDLALPLAVAIDRTARVYWPLSFWSQVVRPGGLAESHFEWQAHVIRLVRRSFRWFMPLLVPLTAAFYYCQAMPYPAWQRSVGRLTLVMAVLSIGWFLRRILSPASGVPQQYLGAHRGGWLHRLRFMWYGTLLVVPMMIAVLAVAGYQYSAQRLSECLFRSAVLLSMVYFAWAVSLRWTLLNRRSLAIAQAKERLAAGVALAPDRKLTEGTSGGVTVEQVDLVQVNEQTRRLLTSCGWLAGFLGLYLIWTDVLPALERLNDIHLWEISTDQPTGRADATAAPAVEPVTQRTYESITLGNLVGSVLTLVMTWIAIRNIPGLLEIAVLQHLPLDASIRFAVTTITRYALILAGFAGALSNLGFGWSKIQWLVAAVSVGLGFGLQEIFANFISGLILLFERPLRAGDVVTVGDVTGKVVEIRTRATTIQDWDLKELIVPNKEFITGKLLNWTLSNTLNRLVIQVGVAYGSEIDQTRRVILDAARSNQHVLEDPPPTVTFDLMGDSALKFTLRCFLADLDRRLEVIHDLHTAIYRELSAAGIVIPFPQRDVHLISHVPLGDLAGDDAP